MIVLLLKVTVLLALPLALLPLMRKSSAAIRHLFCVCSLAGGLLLPLTSLFPAHAGAFRISTDVVASASRAAIRTGFAPGWLIWLWVAGTLVLLLRLATGYLAIRRIFQSATSTGAAWLADVSVPVATGLLNPRVLLPRAAETWPESQLQAALAHELRHIERKDLWTMLLGHVACAVWWFHPLVWLVAGRARAEQESACDDAVLAAGFDPATYAEALVAVARHLTSTRLIGCHMLTNQTLKSRIARLFDGNVSRVPSTSGLRRAIAASAAAILFVGMSVAQDDQVYKMGPGISAPKVIAKVDPDYTQEARDAKIAGTVTLVVVVGSDGAAHNITVEKSLDPGLDEKAVEAVAQWQFQPATKDGNTVNVRATIEINFRLN